MSYRMPFKRCILLIPKQYLLTPTACYGIDVQNLRPIEKPTLESVKRGTGHRSSFNGIICTVFGASGCIGKHVINRLGQHGTQIIVPYRSDPYFAMEQKLSGDLGQILFTHFHLEDEESLRKAMKYSDVVINCIGADYHTFRFPMEKVHIDGAQRIAKLAREMGIKKLIQLSALGASPDPPEMHVKGGSRFMKSKWHGELAVRSEFPDAIIVRPSEVYGEWDRYFTYYGEPSLPLFKKVYLWGRGLDIVKRPIWARDVASGLFELVVRHHDDVRGKTYQFVGSRKYLLYDLVRYYFKFMWKDESERFGIEDSRCSLLFPLYRTFFDKVYVGTPKTELTWERFERENTSDVVDPNLPTIQDLGVNPRFVEDLAFNFLFYYRAYPAYQDDPFEFETPELRYICDD